MRPEENFDTSRYEQKVHQEERRPTLKPGLINELLPTDPSSIPYSIDGPERKSK